LDGVEGGNREEHEAEHVDLAPELSGQPAHRQRGHLDGQDQVHGGDAPCDRTGSPVRGEWHQHLLHTEVHISVGHERADVDGHEDDGQSAEEPVQIEVPSGSWLLASQAARMYQPEKDGGRQKSPCHQPSGTGEIPPDVLVHIDHRGHDVTISHSHPGSAWANPPSSTSTPDRAVPAISAAALVGPAVNAAFASTSAQQAVAATTVTDAKSVHAEAPVAGSITWWT
jgi:hypothetical protein